MHCLARIFCPVSNRDITAPESDDINCLDHTTLCQPMARCKCWTSNTFRTVSCCSSDGEGELNMHEAERERQTDNKNILRRTASHRDIFKPDNDMEENPGIDRLHRDSSLQISTINSCSKASKARVLRHEADTDNVQCKDTSSTAYADVWL